VNVVDYCCPLCNKKTPTSHGRNIHQSHCLSTRQNTEIIAKHVGKGKEVRSNLQNGGRRVRVRRDVGSSGGGIVEDRNVEEANTMVVPEPPSDLAALEPPAALEELPGSGHEPGPVLGPPTRS
jgi:hypothetical protein